MLQLKNIIKTYVSGELKQTALKEININFRKNEFVSILGQSGSGKTTILNIIGGLDKYDSGDLIINGVSTKKYSDCDWDYYRNNSIGFVFQNYNLIPHQTVLANVEMALTLCGISKQERRKRAIDVLKRVGLIDHVHKKPNQMSGGQMQRVAIARALINNPDILLADEPTGALDSETSLQIMELLKEISKDKLIIMVTHNPELAQEYSTRIVKLLDGNIVNDSNPFNEENIPIIQKDSKKISMSFLTALSLSFNNLKTKKARTVLTSFAGSIGIIGIALILSLSNGMNKYIDNIQKETMASYPITISSEDMDISNLIGIRSEIIGNVTNNDKNIDRSKIYADYSSIKNSEKLSSSVVKNNLKQFKKYIDDPNNEIHQYLSENGIVYAYDTKFKIYSHDKNGNFIDSDTETIDSELPIAFSGNTMNIQNITNNNPLLSNNQTSFSKNFSQILPGTNDTLISNMVKDSYDIVHGKWPEHYNEVVLVLDKNNQIPATKLYQLGLITKEQYNDIIEKIKNDEDIPDLNLNYSDIFGHEFYLITKSDHYVENTDGTFTYIESYLTNENTLIEKSLKLKIVGIIRPIEDSSTVTISTTVAYTKELTDYVIEQTDKSPIVLAQKSNPEINVLNNTKFIHSNDDEKIDYIKIYLRSLGVSEKASFYNLMLNQMQGTTQNQNSGNEISMASSLDRWLDNNPDRDILLKIYDEYFTESSYDNNMTSFGKIDYDDPSSISIYTDNFENKEHIMKLIEKYNTIVDENNRITYTDYISILTSSLTLIINGISWLLIGFVGISLLVSCIMISIITHISVMERTKEIGILRSLGASKKNISQVFNAETFIIGCFSGIIGIVSSIILIVPINSLIMKLTTISNLNAILPFNASIMLIILSIVITIIGGLIPAKNAARKDPVIALRTE